MVFFSQPSFVYSTNVDSQPKSNFEVRRKVVMVVVLEMVVEAVVELSPLVVCVIDKGGDCCLL